MWDGETVEFVSRHLQSTEDVDLFKSNRAYVSSIFIATVNILKFSACYPWPAGTAKAGTERKCIE